jgi:dihydropyrimidine dehydrogenase (NAD+) subunit PreA
VKLSPNISDVTYIGVAAREGGADGLSLINTINSIMGIDLDTLAPRPIVDGKSSHGGYCGPAVKPIALNMVSALAKHPKIGIPISGIGGIATWRDAAEFILLGASSVQVCTAIMHYGFRIVEDMIDGLSNWMDERGFRTLDEVRGQSLARVTDWGELNLNYKVIAEIHHEKCIGCHLCYVACEDGAHQSIRLAGDGNGGAAKVPEIIEDRCVGCNLCMLVCPVPGCITMKEVATGRPPTSWRQYQEALGKGVACELPGERPAH